MKIQVATVALALALSQSPALAAAPSDCGAKLDYLADLATRTVNATTRFAIRGVSTYPFSTLGAVTTGIALRMKLKNDAIMRAHKAEVTRLGNEAIREMKNSGMKWIEYSVPSAPAGISKAVKYAARGAPLGIGVLLDLLLNSQIADAATIEGHYAQHPGELLELNRSYACSLIEQYPNTVGTSVAAVTQHLQTFHFLFMNSVNEQ